LASRTRVRSALHGGLRPPLLCAAVNVCRRKNDLCDARTHVHKSGRRQPAVGLVTQLQRCSCKDHRPVASARQMRASRCERVSETTAGLRQPLLVARTWIVAEKRLRFATPGQAAAKAAAAGAFRRSYASAICNGILFPPLLVARRAFGTRCAICDAKTLVRPRAAALS
jgi:hypothetical protein